MPCSHLPQSFEAVPETFFRSDSGSSAGSPGPASPRGPGRPSRNRRRPQGSGCGLRPRASRRPVHDHRAPHRRASGAARLPGAQRQRRRGRPGPGRVEVEHNGWVQRGQRLAPTSSKPAPWPSCRRYDLSNWGTVPNWQFASKGSTVGYVSWPQLRTPGE